MLVILHFHREEKGMIELLFTQILNHLYIIAQLIFFWLYTTIQIQELIINHYWIYRCQYCTCLLTIQLIILFYMEAGPECMVCLLEVSEQDKVQLKCSHIFCKHCIVKFIETLRLYNQLRPEKLCCLAQQCSQEIEDSIITRLFPGEMGFIFTIIKKRYKQLNDPNMIIFDCKGYLTADLKPLIPKPDNMSREQHSTALNSLSKKIMNGEQQVEGSRYCKNIFSFNKKVPRKEKITLCMKCGCSYCVLCFGLAHQGGCPAQQSTQEPLSKAISGKLDPKGDDFSNFVSSNQILVCLNPKCQVPIAKEEGCFWVKCRCSYQMCYPCKTLWGDCEHFHKYPYSKFTPPPAWLAKALDLF